MAERLTSEGCGRLRLWRLASGAGAVLVGAFALGLVARAVRAVRASAGEGAAVLAELLLALLWVLALRGLVQSWRLRSAAARFWAAVGLALAAFFLAVAVWLHPAA